MRKLRTTGLGLILLGLSALGIGYLASILPLLEPPEDQAEPPRAPTQADLVIRGNDAGTVDVPKDPREGEVYLAPLDISGRATDPGGQPVAGATVYVIDWRDRRPGARVGQSRLLTTATSGPDGRFVARGVKLGAEPMFGNRGPEVGLFQVVATAPGFGLTWHEVIRVHPDEPRPPRGTLIDPKGPEDLYRGEPIRVDLAFDRPASLSGRLVDDLGRPIAGVAVQVGICDDIRRSDGGKTWSCVRLDPTGKVAVERRDLKYIESLPDSWFSTRTRPDGTYRIDGLPREAQFLCLIDPGPEYEALNPTIATTAGALPGVLSLGHDAVLDHTFLLPREVRLSVRSSDTDRPMRNATVRARTDRTLLRSGCVGATDDQGGATLRLRPGEYDLVIEPPLDAPYRPGRRSLKVGREAVAEIGDLKLDPAAVVTLEAIDAKTGAAIEGVRFQYETDSGHERRGLASQLAIVHHPATDERGRLRAVVEPGRRRFFVESAPEGWEFQGAPGAPLDLAAGRETTARFALAKVEVPAAHRAYGWDPSIFPEELVETWRRQQRASRTGKFRIREYFIMRPRSISMAELDASLDRLDPGHPAELVATIRARFPETSDPGKITEIVADAGRTRDTERHRNPEYISIRIENGTEYIGYGIASKDASIHKNGTHSVHLLAVGNFTYWPTLGGLPVGSGEKPGVGPAIRRTEGPDGRLTIEHETENGAPRWVVDRTTGFVHAYSARPKKPNPSVLFGEEIRQYGPKVFANGVVLPTIQLQVQLSGDRIQYITMKVVDEADLTYRPGPLDFAMAVPAGTLIVNRRESSAFPNQGIAHYPVADVVAFADEMDVRYRSIEPVVKIGQPAPPIKPAAWFDRDGPAEAPALAGKVVLVDFWGITCRPCMAELPEIQAAADRFAARGQDFALIGIHNSGPTADAGAGFARKQGLTYRLAIDRPAAEEGWVGATFQSYGVRPNALPAAAVIDRQGKVAFVGPFREALQKAADLLGQ